MPETENYTARLKVLMAQMERKLLSIKGNVGNVSFLNLFLLTSGFEVSMFASTKGNILRMLLLYSLFYWYKITEGFLF